MSRSGGSGHFLPDPDPDPDPAGSISRWLSTYVVLSKGGEDMSSYLFLIEISLEIHVLFTQPGDAHAIQNHLLGPDPDPDPTGSGSGHLSNIIICSN